MRLLVTGGSGFIGSAFIRWVLANVDDVQVVNLDLLTYAGNPENLRPVEGDDRYRFIRGDVREAESVRAAMAGCDAVVHFAAESHVDRSIDGPESFLSTNVVGAGVVFEASRRLEIDRVLHISTDEVYGTVSEGSFTESDALEPNSPYSASKAGADLLARAYRETYGFPIMVTRTTNNFGPYQYPEKMIPLFITNLMEGSSLPVYGDGSNVRDWLYVDDNAAAQWAVLTEGGPGETYNVGAGNELTNLELTRAILDRFGFGEERIEYVADRPGHDQRYSVDTDRIRRLGWQPRVALDEALDMTVAWYRTNRDWWRPLKDRGAATRRGVGG